MVSDTYVIDLKNKNYFLTVSRPIAQFETQAWHYQWAQGLMARQVIATREEHNIMLLMDKN